MTTRIRTTLAAAVAGTAALALSSHAALAQGTDARWRAWTGCWKPVSAQAPFANSTAVCVVPANGRSAVDFLSVNGTSVTSRTHVDADGVAHPVSRDGCTGTEKATWSATGTRVYLRELMTCDGGITRNGTGVMSFDPRYEWLDVRGVSTGSNAGVAVARYEAVLDTAGFPAEVMPAFAARGPAANNAILAASAPLTLGDISDVSAMTDSGVTATWLVERNRDVRLDLNGKQLTTLADQGVPPSVIDVLVALSHPTVFALNANGNDVAFRDQPPRGQTSAQTMRDLNGYGSARYGSMYGAYDPWGWGYGYGYSSLFYSPYYSPYSPYYSPYYNPYYGYYPGSQPIIIVTRSDGGGAAGGGSGSGQSHGRVVKGQGYTSGSSSGGSSASSSRGSEGSSSGSSAGSSGASSSGGSSGSSSAGRTAVRKPPL